MGFLLGGLLALLGVAGSVALLAVQGPVWGLLVTGILIVLGIWLLSRSIAWGKRSKWTFDRASGELLYRDKPFRSLSSITHVSIFVVEWPAPSAFEPNRLIYYVEFSPRQDKNWLSEGIGSWKETLSLRNLKDASQAATIVATFLGVGVVA